MQRTEIFHRGMKAPVIGWRPLFWVSFCLGLYLIICVFQPPVISADSRIPYFVAVEGVEDHALKKLLESVSKTFTLRKSPPASLNLLHRRINSDIPRLLTALRSQGYYRAKITNEIREDKSPIISDEIKEEESPLVPNEIREEEGLTRVIFIIETGPPYSLKSIDIRIMGEGAVLQEKFISEKPSGLLPGQPARSKEILDAAKKINQWLQKQGFPFPKTETPKVVVDHAEESVSITYQVQSGPMAGFGATRIEGLESVDEAFVRNKIPWKRGERFNMEQFGKVRKNLLGADLFATVEVVKGDELNAKGQLPITIKLRERKHRTVKAGVSYKTDEGPGASLSWAHRNVFGRGERLNLKGNVSGIGFGLEGEFRKPEFRRPDQALLLNARLADDRPDAFTSRNFTSMARIERTLGRGLSLAIGPAFRLSRVEQLGKVDRFKLLFLPASLNWDYSNDLLNPSQGGRLNLQLTPFYEIFGKDLSFGKGYTRYSHYVPLMKKSSLIFALRGTLGAMGGAERDEIPADIRFYAGGGGSIRGYAYQSVAPRIDGQPVGGRSLFSVAAELRFKVTKSIGLVTFLDGGNAFESVFPDFEEDLQWGAGLGLRYFTPVGPLRLDVGVPINRRDGIDDAFQIYISIGQAF
ncbi:autotransporter assembly complex family protein [Thermodesulfobacteriota bacterium]